MKQYIHASRYDSLSTVKILAMPGADLIRSAPAKVQVGYAGRCA